MEVGGIGNGTRSATQEVSHNIGLNYARDVVYTAPELPNSSIPGLLGMKTMREHGVLLVTYNNIFYKIGQGGYDITMSPGSSKQQLELSHAGHLMLPCTRYPQVPQQPEGPTTVFTTEPLAKTKKPSSSSSRSNRSKPQPFYQ